MDSWNNQVDMVEALTRHEAASLAVPADRAEAEPVETVETLRTRLAVVVDAAKADAANADAEAQALRDGGRLAAAVLAVLAARMGSRLDYHSHDFGRHYGEAARQAVRETADMLSKGEGSLDHRTAYRLDTSLMVALVDWLLPATWREALVESVREELVDSVRSEVAEEIREEVEDEIRDEIRDEIKDELSGVSDSIDSIRDSLDSIAEAVDSI